MVGAGFGMAEAHYDYCEHNFCYYDLSSDAGHQARILEVGPPLLGHDSLTCVTGGLLRATLLGPSQPQIGQVWGARLYISKKFPDDTDAAGPRDHTGKLLF